MTTPNDVPSITDAAHNGISSNIDKAATRTNALGNQSFLDDPAVETSKS